MPLGGNRELFHLQKGSNRFISTATTKHQVFSNSGGLFESPDHGFIVIDLLYVPRDTIQDVHTEEAITSLLSLKPVEFNAAMKDTKRGGTVKDAAVRDVVRTREVLVEGWIPYDSILYASKSKDPWLGGYIKQYNAEERASLLKQHPSLAPLPT